MDIKITINEKQAAVLLKALDLYSRVLIGQTENVEEVLRDTYWTEEKAHVFEPIRACLVEVKKLLWGFGGTASFSIRNKEVNDNARISFDMLQTIRSVIAWKKNPKGGIQVHFDKVEPLSNETLPSVEII